MKSLKEYIIESFVNEGGNAVVCDKIPAAIAKELYEEIKNKILTNTNGVEVRLLGSVGKKNPHDTHGDIDIAINITDLNELLSMINDVFPDVEYNKSPGLVSIGYPFEYKGKQMVGQVDFMMQEDLDWAEFFYSSPDYTKNESQFKANIRNILFSIAFSCIPIEGQPDYGEEAETRWKYTLSMKGLSKQFLDYRGKKGLLKNPKKVKELEQFISKNAKDVIGFLFHKPSLDIYKSVETLWNELHTSNFKYPGVLQLIESRFEEEVLKSMDFDLKKFDEMIG